MIILSFLLVVIAAITLVIGLFADSLTWIWASIGSCLLALLFLGIGVLQRRGAPAPSAYGDEDAYADAMTRAGSGVGEDVPPVVPKRTAAQARESIQAAGPELAEATAAPEREAEDTPEAAARRRLAGIRGVGEGKADALLEEFGSIERIRMATVDELTRVKGIGRSLAEHIRSEL